MVRGVFETSSVDRPRGRAGRLDGRLLTAGQVDDLLVVAARTALCIAAFAGGWLFAEHVDPHGHGLRLVVGWLVGEGR